jgi:hypothetical protein
MTATTPILALEYPIDTDAPGTLGVHTAIQNLAEDFDAKWGQFTTWTPQVDQGATTNIAKTVNVARYKEIGKFVEFEMRLAITGTGTASAKVTFTLPVAAKWTGNMNVGWGGILDSSVPTDFQRVGALDTGSATKVGFRASSPTSFLGASSFTAALASGDIIYCVGFYERT